MQTAHIVNSLKTFMLTRDAWNIENPQKSINNPQKSINNTSGVSKNTKVSAKPEKLKDVFLTPSHKDKLFWCFYILKFGEDSYDSVYKNVFKTEKAFKLNAAEDLINNEPLLKAHKLKRINIENDLINEKTITISCLYALCLIYKVNILYVVNRTFYKFIGDAGASINVLKKDKKGDIGIVKTINVDTITNDFYEILNHAKPILSFSAYKLAELQDIAHKVEVALINELGKKKTKKKLYEDILTKF
jgi:hypothetical protein